MNTETPAARAPRHAVFVTYQDTFRRARVSGWVDWNRAQDEWTRLDDLRRAGDLPDARFFEVRSSDDPKYNTAPHEPWAALTETERPTWVKLSRPERDRLLRIGRDAGDLESASHAMFDELMSDPRWGHLDAVTISDYTWAAANFCFPHESKWM